MQFFRLSGGILKTNAVTSNRIDDLLGNLMEHPCGCTYIPNIDKNLDHLFTYMKLDMIGRAADDVSAMNRKRSEGAEKRYPPERVLLD
jgi:hypothetical protein